MVQISAIYGGYIRNEKEKNMEIKFSKKQLLIVGVIAFYFLGSVLMNILAMKTLQIGGVSFFTFGIIMSPIVFACNDILTECMGKKFAFKTILISAGINLAWALICALGIMLPGNNKYISECFSVILGSTWRITAASTIAYIGGGYINNLIMDTLHKKHGDKKYYLRAISSTAAGQLIDDFVFVFLAFAPLGISTIENPWSAIFTIPFISAATETAIESLVTPISKKICTVVSR